MAEVCGRGTFAEHTPRVLVPLPRATWSQPVHSATESRWIRQHLPGLHTVVRCGKLGPDGQHVRVGVGGGQRPVPALGLPVHLRQRPIGAALPPIPMAAWRAPAAPLYLRLKASPCCAQLVVDGLINQNGQVGDIPTQVQFSVSGSSGSTSISYDSVSPQ